MPVLLKGLSVVGTAAMIWVGGGIVLHGLEMYGPPATQHAVHAAEEAAARVFPPAGGLLKWIAEAAISGVVGFVVGAVTIPFASFVLAPAWARAKGFRKS
jgi:predicted DNA repair protein MutK